MSPPARESGGIPHIRRGVAAPPGGISAQEDWRGANQAKLEKLRRNTLERRAGVRGFHLRHSEYGYALIDPAHKRIDDRIDMTLDEIESWLDRG